ncbi:ATP-grasp domain-containing protein [Parablautia sp. Marseille-Q6255]|uniref:ATP-grasp domain-containing protein n=1 Tax=Parablautia sp. Marseille-Q6255 TaxID=3039593 RepID=UPI0024BD3C5D|nr:ATP-grasp domain-containing protein [Parablautia sp. Marseille-Q6255]
MKKLMVMGAGTYQVPLIKKAREMGVYTIVVSIPGKYPGFAFADEICYEDTVNYDKILQIAKEKQIDGIVTAGTDVAVITIGKVCDELGLTGLSFEAAQIASNKIRMKKKYEEYGVRTARFREVSFEEDMYEAVRGLDFPLIFKAVDTSGSRGIVRVDSVSEFEGARRVVKENTRTDFFIIEEFIEGKEFGAQAFVYHGEVKFILPHGDYVFQGDTGVPIGHFAPYELDDAIIADAKVQLEKAIVAMGLDNCAINADFILKDDKTYVLELGGRSGATCLAELVSIYYGFDYYEKLVQAALGEEVEFPQTQAVPNASMLLRSEKDGVICSIENRNRPDEDIYAIQFDYGVGDRVKKFHVGPNRIGHVITKGKTLDAAVEKLHEALEQITVTVEEK